MKINTKTILFLLLLPSTLFCQIGEPGYFEQHFQERLARGLVFDIIQDRQGFMWFGTEYGLARFDGYELRYFQHEPGNPYSLRGNVITCLLEDSQGYIWVGTLSSGLHRFDPETERFINFANAEGEQASTSDYQINDLVEDRERKIWVATEGGGLDRWDPELSQFDYFSPAEGTPSSLSSSTVRALYCDTSGVLWIGTALGLDRWDPTTGQFYHWPDQDAKLQQVNTLAGDSLGRLWIGTRQGELFKLEKDRLSDQILPDSMILPAGNSIHSLCVLPDGALWTGSSKGLFIYDADHPAGLHFTDSPSRKIFSLCYSSSGLMWVGTNSGFRKLPLTPPKFLRRRTIIQRDGNLYRPGVMGVCPLDDHRLLIGTSQGPFILEKGSRELHRELDEIPGLSFFERSTFVAQWKDSRGAIWISTVTGFNSGWSVFRLSTDGTITNFSSRFEPLRRNVTRTIGEDQQGNIWLGTAEGLIRYDPQNDTIKAWVFQKDDPNSLPDNHIRKIFTDSKGRLWLGTDGSGMALYRPSTDNFESIHTAHPQVLEITEGPSGKLWLGTQGGLNRFDPDTHELSFYSTADGLPDNTIESLLFDHEGVLWIGTKNGFARFQQENNAFQTFNIKDGIQYTQYWERSCLLDGNGYLFFGGAGGFNYFHPDSLRWNETPPPVHLTEFRLFNRTISPFLSTGPLTSAIGHTERLLLNHRHKVLTFRYTALNYHNTTKNQFAYQLEGFDDGWQYVGDRREVTYTNLDPGSYTFRVKATNEDGIWNEEGTTMELIVLPPWHASWWAYLIYIIVLSSAIYFFYQFQLNRKLAEAEAIRLRDLDAVKSRLYTNITHEFRTPLTLIQGPVEQALRESGYSLGNKELERIRQNCRRLLHLIRQMLHLSKLEVGAVRASYVYADVIPALKYIVDAFSSFAESQKVKLNFRITDPVIFMDYDQEKLLDILSNLVSNAVKFTPAGGKVTVEAGKAGKEPHPFLEVKVQDTGPGIAEDELDKIFDRFYQSTETRPNGKEESVMSGSGIGLSLSKKLAELIDGTIRVESDVGAGSTFTLRLPIRSAKKNTGTLPSFSEIYIPDLSPQEIHPTEDGATPDNDGPSILIVEDNTDVANFIAGCLSPAYRNHIAGNGWDGLQWATEHIPDLIISDVLMPQMDGYDLTRELKKDLRTSHVPIILLTAKADISSRIEGLGKGADAYMAKPFDQQELLIRIENLLASRRRLQAYYLQQSGLQETAADIEQAGPQENAFLNQVRQWIEEHLEAGDASIENLAHDFLMSQTQLYRKMTALTGQSSSKFFRNIQIKQAKKLLTDSELNISQIAYQTGFNDPAYFSRVFAAETGDTPTAFREKTAHG